MSSYVPEFLISNCFTDCSVKGFELFARLNACFARNYERVWNIFTFAKYISRYVDSWTKCIFRQTGQTSVTSYGYWLQSFKPTGQKLRRFYVPLFIMNVPLTTLSHKKMAQVKPLEAGHCGGN